MRRTTGSKRPRGAGVMKNYYEVHGEKTFPHARKALKAYAESVRKDNPQFANDLERWLQDLKIWKEAD